MPAFPLTAYRRGIENGRWLALLLIFAVHVLAVLAWPRPVPAHIAGGKVMQIVFFATPVVPSAPLPTPSSDVALARQRQKDGAPRLAMTIAPATVAPAPPPAPPTITPSVTAPVLTPIDAGEADRILSQARRDAGRIDRELREEGLTMADRKRAIGPSKFERLMADAFIERGPPRMEEHVMADGRRVSKVGKMCAYKEANGLTGARDVFKDGTKTRWETCPE